jgi:mannose-1-phosphate guanylyltransferase
MINVMIMAGGKGTRFWPLSRKKKAKQFLSIIDEVPLINTTLDRISAITTKDQRWILGNQDQNEYLEKLTDQVHSSHILKEPFGKNTAACIGWSAFEALKKDPNAICVILSADAWIDPVDKFQDIILKAVEEVKANDSVVTIGIKPTSAHTGYGYIETKQSNQDCMDVISFKEKPTKQIAQNYIKQSNYFWNAGIFIWSAQKIVNCLKEYLPNHYNIIKEFTDKNIISPTEIAPYYEKLDSISIDYAIMEKIGSEIKLIPATFKWDDIGNWASLENHLPKDDSGNAIKGKLVSYKSSNNIVVSNKKLIALANIDNLIIVESDDAILVLPKNDDQSIKALYEKLDDTYK